MFSISFIWGDLTNSVSEFSEKDLLRNKIPNKERASYDEVIDFMVNANMKILLDENGKFKMDIDYNHKDMYGPNSSISIIHKKLLKFIETQDLNSIFPKLKIR